MLKRRKEREEKKRVKKQQRCPDEFLMGISKSSVHTKKWVIFIEPIYKTIKTSS
jgi:hypothetical protein